MGALIDAAARDRIERAVARAESEGAQVLLDGRKRESAAENTRAATGWERPSSIACARAWNA